VNFFKHARSINKYNKYISINKLTIFGAHNLQTFKHYTLINKLLLMQFYLIIFVLNCITESDENYASHCTALLTCRVFRTFSTSPLMLFFVQPLSGNSVINCRALQPLHSYRFFFNQNCTFFTERRQSFRVCLIQRQNSSYFRCPV